MCKGERVDFAKLLSRLLCRTHVDIIKHNLRDLGVIRPTDLLEVSEA